MPTFPRIVVFSGLFLFPGFLDAAEPDQSTPQKAWESIEAARAAEDDAAVFRCMTPMKQQEVLARTLLEAILWAGRPQKPDADNPMSGLVTELSEILHEHGIDAVKTVEEFNERSRNSDRLVRETEKNAFLLERFQGDQSVFYPKVRKLMRELQTAYIKFYEEEHRKQGHPVPERKKPEPDQFLSAKETGDRAVVVFKKMIDPNMVFEIGGQRIRSREETRLFRKIDNKWYMASETGEPQKIEVVKIAKSQIPYKEPIDLGLGKATYFELDGAESGKNRIAFWGGGGIGFGVGEKPFTEIAVKYKTIESGSQTLVDDSYIRRGGVTYSGSNRSHEFFVEPYKITLSATGRRPMLEIVEATQDELLVGDTRRDHFLKLLESPEAKDRYKAFEGLMEMKGSVYIGDLDEICDKIRSLTSDKDETMAAEAVNVLCVFGDEQTLLDVMDDPERLETVGPYFGSGARYVPGKTYRQTNPIYQGEKIANWNLRRRSEAVKTKAASFFQSKDEKKYKFAVGYFTRVSDRENEAVKEAMLAARKHESPEIRAKVVGELRSYVSAEAVGPMITEMLEDKDEKVITEALRAANGCNQHIDSAVMTPFLKHPNKEIRLRTCYALHRKKDAETTKALLEATRHTDRQLRGAAADTLGINGAKEAIDRLAEMIRDDPEPEVRKQAVHGLRRINDEKVLPIFKEALAEEKNGMVRNVLQESIRRGE